MARLIVFGLMVAAASPVLAQSAPMAPTPPHAPRGDRIITRAEVQSRVQTHFTKIDANRDGFVTSAEIDARRSARSERWQRNGVGHAMMIKRGDPNAAFDRIDANKDGMVSRDEFAKGREVRIEKHVVRHGGAPGEPGPLRMKMHHMGHGGMFGGAMLKMADANGDGRISLAEATGTALKYFDMADTNRDGRITPDERRGGHIMIREKRMRDAG